MLNKVNNVDENKQLTAGVLPTVYMFPRILAPHLIKRKQLAAHKKNERKQKTKQEKQQLQELLENKMDTQDRRNWALFKLKHCKLIKNYVQSFFVCLLSSPDICCPCRISCF